MPSDEMLAWLKFAIDAEKRGYEFYRVCAEKIKDQRAQELFNWLVGEEIKHEKALKAILDAKSGNDNARMKKAVEKFNQMGGLEVMFSKEDLNKITDKRTMIMEMFNLAADMERKGTAVYLDLEAKYEDPELKALFHDLAKQELRHRKKIVAVSMSLLGMETDEEEQTAEAEEKELSQSKTVIREITITANACEYKPREIKVNKGETVVLKIKATDLPAGFRCIAFQINEYISPGKTAELKFIADTAGEFEFFSNVPCATGTEKMRGRFIVSGENVKDDDL